MPSLEYRRRRGRMIEVYKCMRGGYDSRVCKELFTINDRDKRGNNTKLRTRKTRLEVRKQFFTISAINDWNSLPEEVIASENLDVFKGRLDKCWNTKKFRIGSGQNELIKEA